MRFFPFIFLFFLHGTQAQSYDQTWLLGYPPNDSVGGTGGVMLRFEPFGEPEVIKYNTPCVQENSASISDSLGNPILFTNGCNIYNRNFELMENGDTLNPGFVFDNYCNSGPYPMSQGVLILREPNSKDEFKIFHLSRDRNLVINRLLFTDVFFNSKIEGEVKEKNIPIHQDTFASNITAVKHGNGEDWWVITPKNTFGNTTNIHFKFLFSSDGIEGPFSQAIGDPWGDRMYSGQSTFSKDGSKYALINPFYGLYLYDFDRCSGELINPTHIEFPGDTTVSAGVAFSSNNRFLYVSTTLKIYQFDMEAQDIEASKLVVANYDGFFSGGLPSYFYQSMRARNEKIYISAPNSIKHLTIIHNPNKKGLACNVEQHGLELPTYIGWTTPNFPNYRLGPLLDSPCDTTSSINNAPATAENQFKIYPNPSAGIINVEALQNLAFEDYLITMFDVSGREVGRRSLANNIDLSNLPAGLYFYEIKNRKNKEKPQVGKLVFGI